MYCHSCGTPAGDNQKFCMECGASLKGVADVTGEVPVTRRQQPGPPPGPAFPPPRAAATGGPDDLTIIMAADDRLGTDRPRPDDDRTRQMAVVAPAVSDPARTAATTGLTPRPATATGRIEATYRPAAPPPVATTSAATSGWAPTGQYQAVTADRRERPGFRFRVLLVLAVLGAVAVAVAVAANVITIESTLPDPEFATGDWRLNDFGTNNSVAALLGAAAMVVGGLAWSWGARWGAGLAGGAGAGLAGWAALLIGLAEWPLSAGQQFPGTTFTRDVGYVAIAAAGGLGVLAFLGSLRWAGRDGRSGLDPWIAALAAASFLLAAGGPLIPQGSAGFSANYTSTIVDLPAAFFAGRLVQVGLLALCGVAGFLSVRRYGLGLAIGGAVVAGWMLVTAATDQTDSPIGPAFANPGATDLDPHAVTVAGFALVGFFTLVAVVMALLESDR